MKKLIVVLMCLAVCGCAAQWTEEAAREEAFRDAKLKIDVSQYPLIDPNFAENQQAIQSGRKRVADRFVTPDYPDSPFSYIVSEIDKYDNQKNTLFCGAEGEVILLRLFSGIKYPKVAYMYCMQDNYEDGDKKFNAGELTSISLDVSPRERFIFDPDGKLTGHLRR